MHVVLAIKLSEVFTDCVNIETLMILFQKCLEFWAQLFIGESLVPQVLNVVIQGFQGEDIQDLLQDWLFLCGVSMLKRSLNDIKLHLTPPHQWYIWKSLPHHKWLKLWRRTPSSGIRAHQLHTQSDSINYQSWSLPKLGDRMHSRSLYSKNCTFECMLVTACCKPLCRSHFCPWQSQLLS